MGGMVIALCGNIVMVRPMGFAPPSSLLANVSFTTATLRAPRRSACVKSRPATSRMPSVLNQRGEIRFPNTSEYRSPAWTPLTSIGGVSPLPNGVTSERAASETFGSDRTASRARWKSGRRRAGSMGVRSASIVTTRT